MICSSRLHACAHGHRKQSPCRTQPFPTKHSTFENIQLMNTRIPRGSDILPIDMEDLQSNQDVIFLICNAVVKPGLLEVERDKENIIKLSRLTTHPVPPSARRRRKSPLDSGNVYASTELASLPIIQPSCI